MTSDRLYRLLQNFNELGDCRGHLGLFFPNRQAYGQIQNIVRREAYIMAFNDAFLIVGISLLIGAVLVWFCQKTRAKAGAVAH
jgi:hypothetical protein